MTRRSWCKRLWKGRSKGISTVLGTVFLTLVVFAISTNVFIWTLSRNADYTQAVKEETQRGFDRDNEHLIAYGGNYSVSGNEVTVRATLKNAGSVAARVINFWVFNVESANQKYANQSVDLSLNPGDELYLRGSASLTVTLPGSNASHEFIAWFVTARGNTVPLDDSDVLMAEIAQGIGSISMDFPTFRYYEVQGGNQLGPAQFSFNVPAKKDTVFGLYLKNLDPRKEDIALSEYSCFWLSVPPKNAMAYWMIAKVVEGTIVPFDTQVLEYGVPTLVYFGASDAAQLAGNPAACNILLYGTIGAEDYGQNIPFISVFLSG